MAPLLPCRNRDHASTTHLKVTVGVGPKAELIGPCWGLNGAISQSLLLTRRLWLWARSSPWSSRAPGQVPSAPMG